MGVDWFRSPDWDEPARTAFEARLARARPRNRQQYLRIKGLALRARQDTLPPRASCSSALPITPTATSS